MAFDAQSYAEAHHEPPRFRWGGRWYVGRILSAQEWVLLHARRDQDQVRVGATAAQRAEGDKEPGFSARTVEQVVKATLAVAERFTRDCICSWFPAPWYLRWLGAWANPAWRAFRQMPAAVQVEAVKDFSESQRNAMPKESQPPGTTEKNETPDRPSDT